MRIVSTLFKELKIFLIKCHMKQGSIFSPTGLVFFSRKLLVFLALNYKTEK